MRSVALVLASLLMAGCLVEPHDSEAEHRLGGAFTSSATQEDVADFGERMRKHGGDAAIMESFPMQFSVTGFGLTGCEAAEAEARTLAYVASVTDCRPVASGPAGDEPTSSS